MNNKQIELLKFCGFEIDDDHLLVLEKENKNSLVKICFNNSVKLFTIKTQGCYFKPNDYDSIELFTIELSRKLGLVYELNHLKDGDYDVCS